MREGQSIGEKEKEKEKEKRSRKEGGEGRGKGGDIKGGGNEENWGRVRTG